METSDDVEAGNRCMRKRHLMARGEMPTHGNFQRTIGVKALTEVEQTGLQKS